VRVVLQRVVSASVELNSKVIGSINSGLLLLLGIAEEDTSEDIDWLCRKIVNMRIFSDLEGNMNLSVKDIDGDILVVSQFTLHALVKKGNRPSFIKAAKPIIAEPLYEKFKKQISAELNKEVKSGRFGADMQISLINNGPVTIILDSKNKQ